MSKIPHIEQQNRNQNALAKRLGYRFANPALLQQALQHASVNTRDNNEKLEFLGDRVLALVLADALLANYPNETEGELAKRHAFLVSGAQCAKVAIDYSMGKALVFHQKNKDAFLNENMLSDLCEAIIAAIYKDGGLAAARQFILTAWTPILTDMKGVPENPKSALQEYVLAEKMDLPKYKVLHLAGPDHAPKITVQLSISNGESVTATAATRKKAEYAAATKMLAQFHRAVTKTDKNA